MTVAIASADVGINAQPITFTVTPSATANGTISPATPQTVGSAATVSFTVTPSVGYSATVGGTCGGTLIGTTYTTNAVIANCTVMASFTSSPATVLSIPTLGSGALLLLILAIGGLAWWRRVA